MLSRLTQTLLRAQPPGGSQCNFSGIRYAISAVGTVVAWIAGRYDLPDGAQEDVTVELGLMRGAERIEAA